MGSVKVAIKPFLDSTGTSYAANFIDVTKYLTDKGLTAIKTQLDNTDFDIGIFRHSSFNIELNNSDGIFSKPGGSSLFAYKRNDSILRITWEANKHDYPLGFHPPGNQLLSPKVLVGDFFLQDIPAKGSAITQTIKFKSLGYSTLFERILAPYADIDDGDLLSEVIYKCLNQTAITDLMTITAGNLVVDNDETLDDKTLGDLENKTVMEVLKKLLPFGNAVLYLVNADIDDSTSKPTVYSSARTEGVSLAYTFTGPASLNQIENIISIDNDNGGENKVINFVNIPGTAFSATNSASVTLNGLRKKSIEFKPISDQTKNENAASAIVSEFNIAFRGLDVTVPLNYATLELTLLNLVAFDYPIRVLSEGDSNIPYFDIAVFGDTFGFEIKDIEIDSADRFKILSHTVDLVKELITFTVRKVA